MHPILIFTMGQVRQRKGVKLPETRVLDVKYVVRNQTDILEHWNGVKIPKICVLDRKECIEIFQGVCLESYYFETLNQTHANTSFRNRSGASMKWRETTQNMSFGPKVTDWACPLLETRNGSGGINPCFKCISIPVFARTKEYLEQLVNFMNKILIHDTFKTIIC